MRTELAEAVALLHDGDSRAVDRAVALLHSTVFSFSMKMCGHREDAEDTSQEVLVRALPYLQKFDNAQALASWLYKATRNFCVSSRRQSKFAPDAVHRLSLDELMPSGRELEELLAADDPNAESRAIQGEASEKVRRALLKLPPEYRVILVLHDMEGMNAPEVAEVVGIKPGTVRVRLHRARLFVRKELNRVRGSRKQPKTMPRGRGCRGMFAALSDYLDGIMDDATCDEMQVHIKDCAPCQAFVESLRQTVEQCRGYQPKCSPERFQAFRKQLVRQYLEASSTLKKSRTLRAKAPR